MSGAGVLGRVAEVTNHVWHAHTCAVLHASADRVISAASVTAPSARWPMRAIRPPPEASLEPLLPETPHLPPTPIRTRAGAMDNFWLCEHLSVTIPFIRAVWDFLSELLS